MATNFSANRRYTQAPSFNGPVITGGVSSGAENAADMVDVGAAFTSNRATAPRFDEIGNASMAARARERAAIMQAEAATHATGMDAMATLKAAKMQGKASENAAEKKATGSMVGSTLSAVATVGSALLLSDETTKDAVTSIEDALSTLRQLKPVSFYYKEEFSLNPERKHNGFIAQDYQKVMPDATYYDEELGKLCIDTSELIGLLVRAIQQLETRVTRMEAANALVGV